MTASTFRETVALVAEKARAKLPQAVNGRIEGAVKLVLSHDVVRLEDGTIEVGSSSDPLKVYRLSGHACTCKDFTDGKAPEGWCRHRIAAGIQKRVRELLPLEPPCEAFPDNDPGPVEQRPPTPPAHAPLPEARCSVNVRVPIAGRETQITLRGDDETEVLSRLEALLARYPVPQPAPAPAHHAPGEGWCAKHGLQMTQTTKDGRAWWSHRTPDGQWCKGR